MPRDPKKYLYDIRTALEHIAAFTQSKSFDDYRRDPLLRSAVERQFEITGEALSQLSKLEPDTAARIPQSGRIIAFRNVLIHRYATIDDRLVWGVVEDKLPELRRALESLLPGGS
jgi:uncharacterized protein with HEPN domain